MRALALVLSLLAEAGLAQTPMTAAEFEAYTTGKTLTFFENGAPYGAERYLPGRRVRWSFLDGQCKDGLWFAEGAQICFVYEDDPEPQCWSFYREGGGLRAIFANMPGSTELYEAGEATELVCLGPDVGA